MYAPGLNLGLHSNPRDYKHGTVCLCVCVRTAAYQGIWGFVFRKQKQEGMSQSQTNSEMKYTQYTQTVDPRSWPPTAQVKNKHSLFY